MDAEIRSAVQVNNANIQLGADIDLSNNTLSIPAGNTVTLNQILLDEVPSYQMICRFVTNRQLQVLCTLAETTLIFQSHS